METICIQTDDDLMQALKRAAKDHSSTPEIIAKEALSRYLSKQGMMNISLPRLSISEEEVKISLAVRLFEEERVSLGKAAQIAGYSEKTFAELLVHKGIYPIRYDEFDIEEDFQNA